MSLGKRLFDAVKCGNEEVVESLLQRACEYEVNWIGGLGPYGRKGQGTALIEATREQKTKMVKMLLAHSDIDVNIADTYGDTALIHASEHGHSKMVELLLAHASIDVNIKDQVGKTSLMLATSDTVVELLLAYPDIDVNIKDKYGNTALAICCEGYQTMKAKLLLAHKKLDVNMRNKNGKTVLMEACHKGRTAIVELLLAHPGIKLDLQDMDGNTALKTAADHYFTNIEEMLSKVLQEKGVNVEGGGGPMSLRKKMFIAFECENEEIVKSLLSDTTADDVNWIDEDGGTALILALKQCHTDIAQLLLGHPNIDANIQNQDGDTALFIAYQNYFTDILEMLLSRGVDVNIQHKDGNTLLSYASEQGRTDVVELLLAHPDIDVNVRSKKGNTALINASLRGQTLVAELLLAHPKIDVNNGDQYGITALMLSCLLGVPGIVKLLLVHPNIDVNVIDKQGKTALMYGSLRLDTEIVELLLAHPGIKLDLQDMDGNTVLKTASNNGLMEIVKLLSAHLAQTEVVQEKVPSVENMASIAENKGNIDAVDTSIPKPCCVTLYTNDQGVDVVSEASNVGQKATAPNVTFASEPSKSPTTEFSSALSKDLASSIVAESDVTTPPPVFSSFVDTLLAITTPAPPSPPLSWLAVRLLESGVDAQLVKDCEQKLVVQEGFVSEADFAEMLPSEIDSAYLKDIGIVGKGVQVKLMRLHKELNAQYSPVSPPPPPLPPAVLEEGSNQQNPPNDIPAFTCGATPIEGIQPLVTDATALHGATSSRLLLRGRFSGTVTDLGRVYTKEYTCVIKCAGREATSLADSGGAKGIQREFSTYENIKELARLKRYATTGCIACYYMHPSAHYLILESFGQDIRCLLAPNFKLAPQLAEAIIAAVATLHSFGVVHCDIKPHNILFELDSSHAYVVKLCDLDGAHKVGDVCAASKLGTKQYEAPEVYFASRAGEMVTAELSMDIFSLGLVLWQVLSRSPYPPMSVEQLQECYTDQHKLFSQLTLSKSTSMYQSLLYSCVKLKAPQERITSDALYPRVRDIAVSKAHPAWHDAQQENLFLKEKVSDKLDGLDKKLDTVLEVMKSRFNALGGEVVGMAEVLRREILLGHEGHHRVLASMKEATQDALELLSEAQEATNTSSAEHTDQILFCINDLQSRMNHSLADGKNNDNTSSSNTVDLEGLLRGVSEELYARFNSLSSQLQEQVQQQSVAGIDSASDRAETLAMNRALTASLQEALKGIASVQNEVYLLKQGQERLGVQVGRVLQDNKRLDTMLRTLIAGTHNIPTYAVILPVVAKTWLKKADPMRLVRNKYRLYFLCSHTHQIAPCGPKGEGYMIIVTKQWVRDAAPVLMAALVMLKLALMAGGIPLPIPDLSSLLTSSALHVKFLDAALHLVQNPPEDHGAAEFAMDKSINLLGSVGTEEVMEDIGRRRVSLEEGSLKAYATIQSVLTTDSINIALSSGLRQVVHPVTGKTAWVLDNESVAEQYCAPV